MKRRTLAETGEDALIARLVALVPREEGAAGPGDDCAVLDDGEDFLTLLKTDALVEGVHFLMDVEARKVGWKAVARVISDFAAMGGEPSRFLVTLALPSAMELCWIEDFYRGMGDCLEKHGGVLAGGETCRVPTGSAAVISIAATGRVARGKVVLRSGGKPGDRLWVTGRLGGSLAGRHLTFPPRIAEGKWLAGRGVVTAMMDVSDGLAADLPRLAKASGCGFVLDKQAVPRNGGCSVDQALGDGEDFELLFAAEADTDFEMDWRRNFPETELTRIGRLVSPDDTEAGEMSGGWDHFREDEPNQIA